MASKRKRATLSAVDFLGLAEKCRVAPVDLDDGTVWVRDMTSEIQQGMFGSSSKRKVRVYDDNSRDVDIPPDGAQRMVKACLVEDGQGGELFDRLWQEAVAENGDEPLFVVVPESDLVYALDIWKQTLKGTEINAALERMGSAVIGAIAAKIREISDLGGKDKNPVEEKKES